MSELDVAIVGMSGLLPGAPDIDTFWSNLVAETCSLVELSEEELEAAGVDPAEFRKPNYVRVGASLEEIDCFDNEFFGISNHEARLLDPQHRLLLEFGWKAFENAGYDIHRHPGRVGVYVGLGLNTYLTHVLLGSPEIDLGRDGQAIILGNTPDYGATRLSYLLNLRGPSMTVQTACSTALVAVHEACQGLLSFQADMALAGACSVTLPNPRGYLYHEASFFSPDGRVRPFDAQATGTVFSSGLALVVLKRREDAERDGDFIHALIKGSAINNDGSDKVGYVAPSIRGQSQVIQDALAISGVDAGDIEYIETHGTGTVLGDSVELRALTEAYRAALGATPAGTQYCAIGSVKSNIGHTDVAAGAVGLIKSALALEHQTLPASLYFETPNPHLAWSESPFRVNERTRPWDSQRERRLAAVSSFGIGGTNAHAILEEADPRAALPCGREALCLTLSARTADSLRRLVASYVTFLAAGPVHNWADICYTSNIGRRAFAYRHAVVGSDLPSLRHLLERVAIRDAPARERELSVVVRADAARAFASVLAPTSLDASGETNALATQLGDLLATRLRDAGVEVKAEGEVKAEIKGDIAGDAPAEPKGCTLIVSHESVWLEDEEGTRRSLGAHAPLGRLVSAIAGHAWELGVGVDWDRFHAGERRWRVPLPTYAFTRRRHWLDGPRGIAGTRTSTGAKNADISRWFYRPVWHETAPSLRTDAGMDGEVILIVTGSGSSALMAEAFRGARIIEVTLGSGFADRGRDQYQIAVDDEHSYEQLATALVDAGTLPRYLLHALLVDDAAWRDDGSEFLATQARGLESLVYLLRQLAQRLADGQRLSVAVAASGFTDALGGEGTNPDKATIIGATRTFPSEYPGIDCRIVDISRADFEADARSAALLAAEFHAPLEPENEIIAIRGGRRWRQTFAQVHVPPVAESPVSEQGVHVILGGLGELGLNLSRYLAERARCTLALVNSSTFVARSEWDAWIAEHGEDHAYSRKIAALRAVEALGANVRIVRCDIADREGLHRLLDDLRAEFGALQTVIHAAGVVENGMIAHKDVTRFADVFRAKVQGTYNLLAYVAAQPGPRVVLCSSMNSLVGGLGQIDNTASNAFVDAAATTTLALEAGEVCAINWGAINSARLAEPVVLPQFADLSREHKKNHMSETEIHQVYDRILGWSLGSRLAVSTIDFGVVLRRWSEVSRVTELARLRRVATTIDATRPARPVARTYRSPVHRFVVEAWAGILGVEDLDWQDDLFTHGAHSLSAVQFSSMVKESLGLRLHAMGLYEFPRVGQLVEYLQKLQHEHDAKAALNPEKGESP